MENKFGNKWDEYDGKDGIIVDTNIGRVFKDVADELIKSGECKIVDDKYIIGQKESNKNLQIMYMNYCIDFTSYN